MSGLSFVVVVVVTGANGRVVQRELCVDADSVRGAREKFGEYVVSVNKSAHFTLTLFGDVMNTFEQFNSIRVLMREVVR